MAVDKLVDSTQLDSDLTSVANAIRTKGGTSGSLAFPAGFVSAVQAIPTGTTPTGTKSITITANGTTTEDVTNYASAEITVNVSGGGGGSILSGSVTPATNSNGMTIDVGASFTHFVIYATTNPGGNGIKAFRASICDFSVSPTNIVSIATNNSGSSLAGSAQAAENQWFTKSGTTVTCVTGISGATYPGYWVEGITYQWYAW